MTSHSGRDMAMLMGGLVAGVIGSRLLPPLLANISGSRRVRSGGEPFAMLMEDHRQILSILDRMADAPTGSKFQRGRLFLMLKRKLAKHAMAEEDVVYPIVHNDSANGNERKHLYDEHAEMKVLLYEIEKQLQSGKDWSGSVLPLRDLIARHVQEEETVIFPELRRELRGEDSPKLSGQIAREEALVI